jgi:hypothetical protein
LPPTATLAIVGATTTEIADEPEIAVSVIVAFADLVGSSTAVAVSVTVGGFDTAAGAVYVIGTPDADVAPDSVPQAAPVQPDPESVHVVPSFFGSFVTLALKAAVWLACTVADPGASVTAIVPGCSGVLVEDPPPHPKNPATAIITLAQIVATFLRATPRGHAIYPPEKRSGTGAAF